MMSNGLASTLLNLSIFYKGKNLCPLNLAAGDMQLSYVLEHSESRLLLVASELRAWAEAILKTLPNPPKWWDRNRGNLFEDVGNQWESEIKRCIGYAFDAHSGNWKPKEWCCLIGIWFRRSQRHGIHDLCLKIEPCVSCLIISTAWSTPWWDLWSGIVSSCRQNLRLQSFGAGFSSIVVPGSVLYRLFFSTLHKTELSGEQRNWWRNTSSLDVPSAPLAPEIHIQFEQKYGVPIIETMGSLKRVLRFFPILALLEKWNTVLLIAWNESDCW